MTRRKKKPGESDNNNIVINIINIITTWNMAHRRAREKEYYGIEKLYRHRSGNDLPPRFGRMFSCFIHYYLTL